MNAETINAICVKLSRENQCVVFNLDYLLAPEHKSPAGAISFYKAVKHIAENAAIYDVDPGKIALVGYYENIVAGAAYHLALHGESHLIKCMILIDPLLSNEISKHPESELNSFEKPFI